MRERLTAIIGIGLLLGLVGSSYWYSLRTQREGLMHLPVPDAPDFIAKNIVLTQFDPTGRAKRKVFAAELTHYPDDRIDIAKPRMVSLRPDEPQLEVTAREADVENGGEKVHLKGDVLITRAAGKDSPAMRLATDRLTVLPDEDRYLTDAPVEMNRGTTRATGTGMEFDNVARTLQLKSQVNTELLPSDKQGKN
ncbi:MAG: LPS export ABC transporter periplasmic protein LptC [Burkholderiaceae bacterium]